MLQLRTARPHPRDCKIPHRPYDLHRAESSKNPIYANSAEMFSEQYEEYNPYYNPYYWDSGPWYLDSGATRHIAADMQKLDQPYTSIGVEITEVKTGGGESHVIHGTGTATVNTEDGSIKLKSVKYIPSMQKNLVSVGAIAEAGHEIGFSSRECWITNRQGHIIASGKRDPNNGLYCFEKQMTALLTYDNDVTTLWHRRLGHLSFPSLYYLSRIPLATRLPKLTHEKKICRCCLAGRQHRERFPKLSENRAIRPGQRIHTDLMGPMQAKSLGGSCYALVFTDDFSRKSWVYFLKHKGETITKFYDFKKRMETETGHPMQALQSD